MTFVSELDPPEVWRHFDHILTIPRASKNEDAMAAYVRETAQRNGLEHNRDEAGNLVVRKPAQGGNASAPITILQSHLDMVNEKNEGVDHDFDRDPIKPRLDSGYLKASGTTLGSDNGIGVATCLALMESKSAVHGPLEFLFTVDEETGLTGASELDSELLQGRRLINTDTEEERAIYVGCAGGAGVNLTLPLFFSGPPADHTGLEVRLRGLKGGHSGVDIHLQRGNAIQLMARILNSASQDAGFELSSFDGGNMRNAIPRESTARLAVRQDEAARLRSALERYAREVRRQFAPAEPELRFENEEVEITRVMRPEVGSRVLQLFVALPHGVQAMSYDIPDLVETSANLATCETGDDTLHIHVSNRSSADRELEALQQKVGATGRLAGAEVEYCESYPGWQPNLESPLLAITRAVFEEEFGEEPQVRAIHAGLECGIIGEKYPGMDMVSIGPQIEFPHSPDERVRIESVADFYRALGSILERLGSEG